MIDGDDGAKAPGTAEHCVRVGNLRGSNAVVDEACCAEGIRVSVEGGQFAAGNEEQFIEVRLQFTLGVVVRGGVVVADGNEVKTALGCSLDGEEEGARDRLSGLAGAASIAVRRVHVQITAIPARSVVQGLLGE